MTGMCSSRLRKQDIASLVAAPAHGQRLQLRQQHGTCTRLDNTQLSTAGERTVNAVLGPTGYSGSPFLASYSYWHELQTAFLEPTFMNFSAARSLSISASFFAVSESWSCTRVVLANTSILYELHASSSCHWLHVANVPESQSLLA